MSKVATKKREPLTKNLLITQIKNQVKAKTTMDAAVLSKCNYPTYLARYRRAGLSIETVQKRLAKGETPEQIVNSVFRKRNRRLSQKATNHRTRSLGELRSQLRGILKELDTMSQAPTPA